MFLTVLALTYFCTATCLLGIIYAGSMESNEETKSTMTTIAVTWPIAVPWLIAIALITKNKK